MSAKIPERMKAARLVAYNKKYEFQTIPVPEIGENELLIKIAAAGFCHTDYQVYQGVCSSPTPITGSHEPVGIIVAVGKQAEGTWKFGQRAGLFIFKQACGKCHGCAAWTDESGQPDIRMCENKQMAGLSHDGGFAEYAVADVATATLIPDEVDFVQAAPLMCAGSTVFAAIRAANTKPGEPVAVVGIGGLGQLGVQFLKALGHPVVAVDNRQEGLDLATSFPEKLSADFTVNSTDEDAISKVKDWAGKGGVQTVICCTDNLSAIEMSLKLLRLRGTLVCVGLPSPDLDGPFRFNAFDLVFSELSIKGSLVADKKLLDEMMAFVAKHGVRSHITTVPFEKTVELTKMYMDKHLKGRLVMKI